MREQRSCHNPLNRKGNCSLSLQLAIDRSRMLETEFSTSILITFTLE